MRNRLSIPSAGRIVYLTWSWPRGLVERCWREGTYNLLMASWGRREMEAAAHDLPTLVLPAADAPCVYFLTGNNFWYQTAFCVHSLLVETRQTLRIVIVDDGTLTEEQAACFQSLFTGVRIVSSGESEAILDKHLPANKFPALRYRRTVYPHLRKVTDVHAGSNGWKLVLDSDMLFHSYPDFLLDWLHRPKHPCHMVDVADSYGYSRVLMEKLADAPIPCRLNVGVCGLCSDEIDWPRLEHWCRVLVEREGTHYLHEQALVAMLSAGRFWTAAPAEHYVVRPTLDEVTSPKGVLHHYVAESKAWYFRYAWRFIANRH